MGPHMWDPIWTLSPTRAPSEPIWVPIWVPIWCPYVGPHVGIEVGPHIVPIWGHMGTDGTHKGPYGAHGIFSLARMLLQVRKQTG